MASSIKASSSLSSSRYTSFDSRSSTQSHKSDPSSSTELKAFQSRDPTSSSRALVKAKSLDIARTKTIKNDQNLTAMVKKFMEKRSTTKSTKTATNLVIPTNFIGEDLKKTARKGTNFTGLHRKLFSKNLGSNKDETEKKALTEVKPNTRTLAMVLRSERELLSLNKEKEVEITRLKLTLEEKSTEVDKLKDLCLKQREEIKALKGAILLPDVMNSQLHELLEKQGLELKQAKQLIPSLHRQVTSLTSQLQYLAEDLAEVKAEKYSMGGCYNGHASSPRTPAFDQEEAANSLEFSSGDHTTPGSPDDMFLKDLNPCLTPYYANTKSKEFEAMGYDSPHDERWSKNNLPTCHVVGFDSHVRKLSRSSDYHECSHSSGSISAQATRRSHECECTYVK
ncbi:unnamed protein product [Ilex paraguariensis]|uniref:Uncharacterized protein n=1 Tax=Ilex paraguariensis TaxID=185542 RepID=A0ABC8UMS0_9AQUA